MNDEGNLDMDVAFKHGPPPEPEPPEEPGPTDEPEVKEPENGV